MKRILKIAKVLLINVFVLSVLLEIVLRIHNPFPSTIKGDKIVLRANYKTVYTNKNNQGIRKEVVVSGNSLGFRGSEPDNKKKIKIFTVGGSTTYCKNVPDNATWSYLLAQKLTDRHESVWLNNAGLPGYSTSGHIILMEDYIIKLKPQIVSFLIGINDVENNTEDKFTLYHNQDKSLLLSIKSIVLKSELASVLLNIWRFFKAKELNLVDTVNFNLKTINYENVSPQEEAEVLSKQNKYLTGYKRRVERLVNLAISNKIIPVLITQPALYGHGVDSVSGKDLAKVEVSGFNGDVFWKRLELYNNITRAVAREYNVPLIDLALLLPKNSALYTDFIHYSTEGNIRISNILLPYFDKIINENFNQLVNETTPLH